MKLPPASRKASYTFRASSLAAPQPQSSPKVIVPSAVSETRSPLLPKSRYFIMNLLFFVNRLLPATAERLVYLDYAQQLVHPDLPEVQFRLEQIAIGVERIELGIHTADISCIRQPFPI